MMSIVLPFYRITREINPVSANFRNLEEQQFLLGAIGDLNGKKISDTLIIIIIISMIIQSTPDNSNLQGKSKKRFELS